MAVTEASVQRALGELLPSHVAVAVLGPDDEPAGLHADEDAAVGERAVPRRRREFALGRTATRRALASLGIEPQAIPRGPQREPQWPTGVVGSITHTAGWAIAAVARADTCGGVGIDLEHRDAWFEGLADEIAFGPEADRLRALPPSERPAATLELFAAKESVYKAFFPRVGRYFGFEAARVQPVGDGLTAELVEGLDPRWPARRPVPVGYRWVGELLIAAVCLDVDT